MKTKIKTILTIILIIIGLLVYDKIQEQQRIDYAQQYNCTWTIYGAHYICK